MAGVQPRLLEQGTYGCAYMPSLPCKKTKAKGRTVGKVVYKKHSVAELSIANLIKSIPGWERYYIVQEEDNCNEKNFHSFHKQDYFKGCKIYHGHDNKLVQMLSPYGGRSIKEISITTSFNLLEFMRHVLEGISKLSGQGISHFDLNSGNILLDNFNTPRLIDFGHSIVGDHVTEADIKHRNYTFTPAYNYQSPEMAVQNAIVNGYTFSEAISSIKESKSILKDSVLIGISLENHLDDMREFWANDTTWDGKSWIAFYRENWRKFDTWAVGVHGLKLLKKCFLLPGFSEKWKVDGPVLKGVIKGCLQSNPMKRLTAAEALKLF